MNIRKTYFMVLVNDMDRAIGFYRDGLGLTVQFQSPDWSELVQGEAVVALHSGGTGQAETGLGFEVDDLEAACEAVTRSGGTIVMPPQDRPGEPIRLSIVRDTEGNSISLSQAKG